MRKTLTETHDGTVVEPTVFKSFQRLCNGNISLCKVTKGPVFHPYHVAYFLNDSGTVHYEFLPDGVTVNAAMYQEVSNRVWLAV